MNQSSTIPGSGAAGSDAPAQSPKLPRDLAYYRLREEIEDFFFREADMIDERELRQWLNCFDEDCLYFMPLRHNVKFGQHAEKENSRIDQGMSWFNDDKWTLSKRVEQILTGVHYAEEPLSRVTHMISNVRLKVALPDAGNANEVHTSCRFLVYQNRVEYETYFFVGKRYDTLVKRNDEWKIRRREIILDQNVLLAKNLSTFF